MRHALILSIALTALAGAAEAQSRPPASGHAAGLRYLTWAGKPDAAPATAPARTAAPARAAAPRVIPHAGGPTLPEAPASAPAPAPQGLTPANAWMRPQPATAPMPSPAYADAPQPMASSDTRAAASPEREGPASPAAADPMAPRRDAAIFRLGPAASATIAPPPQGAQASAASGASARYYSLHRQNGRQPDAIARPAPVYLDALPVELNDPPQSGDLAEPPAAPAVLREANGRIRAAPPPTPDEPS